MAVIVFNEALQASLSEIVSAGYPHETCGVMIGSQSADKAEVRMIVQTKNLNVERAADRFDMDPGDFMAADEQARESGLEIIGIWHSHPDHPARPSQTDLDAAWPGWSYTILSVSRSGIEDFRSWRLDQEGKQFVEESIQV